MNLYRWSSKLMEQYSSGDIIVMAETVEQARQKVWEQWKPLEDGPTEDVYLQVLNETEDDDLAHEFSLRRQTLATDLASEPENVTTGMIFIRGSD